MSRGVYGNIDMAAWKRWVAGDEREISSQERPGEPAAAPVTRRSFDPEWDRIFGAKPESYRLSKWNREDLVFEWRMSKSVMSGTDLQRRFRLGWHVKQALARCTYEEGVIT